MIDDLYLNQFLAIGELYISTPESENYTNFDNDYAILERKHNLMMERYYKKQDRISFKNFILSQHLERLVSYTYKSFNPFIGCFQRINAMQEFEIIQAGLIDTGIINKKLQPCKANFCEERPPLRTFEAPDIAAWNGTSEIIRESFDINYCQIGWNFRYKADDWFILANPDGYYLVNVKNQVYKRLFYNEKLSYDEFLLYLKYSFIVPECGV